MINSNFVSVSLYQAKTIIFFPGQDYAESAPSIHPNLHYYCDAKLLEAIFSAELFTVGWPFVTE